MKTQTDLVGVRISWRGVIPESGALHGLATLLGSGQEVGDALGFLAVTGASGALELAQRAGCLSWSTNALTAMPIGRGVPLPDFDSPGGDKLSRFAFLRREGDLCALESARSPWRVECSAADAGRLMAGDWNAAEGRLLAAVGMLATADEVNHRWLFHDLLFYQRSQPAISWVPPRKGVEPPPEPVRERFRGADRVELAVPTRPAEPEGTLFATTEARRTVRDWSSESVSLECLGHLLWRTLRVKSERPRDTSDLHSYVALFKPVPSGGAMHAAEAWLWTPNVESLEAAWWWYDARAHALVRVPQQEPHVDMSGAVVASPQSPVTIILTARHERPAWKYSSFAHALQLKDVGVALHAIQLTATALGLGAWPFGASHPERLVACLGLDIEVDPPMGEIAIGIPAC